jgi:ABC-type lipoprotein release transport system permease subunit
LRIKHFVWRNLRFFWRTNLAVLAGVATTVGVLTGALLVGDSVRGSLRELSLLRLGRAAHAVTAENFFPEELATRLAVATAGKQPAVPLIVQEGFATHEKSGRRASRVTVYGVDARFWKFHGRPNQAPERREALASPALAAEFGAAPGDSILVRVEKPAAIPVESLHGRKDDLGRTLRLSLKGVLSVAELGEFSIRPNQGEVRALFVPLARLQQDLQQPGKVNAVLLGETPEGGAEAAALLKETYALEDLGLRLRPLEKQSVLQLESDRILLEDYIAATSRSVAEEQKLAVTGQLTYLVNSIRAGDRSIPYSLVTALDAASPLLAGRKPAQGQNPLWLNDWALRELAAQPGAQVELEFYVWQEGGKLTAKSATFHLQGALPMAPLAADRSLAPEFPGISESPSLGDWDPPFPIDLKRIRPGDEEYWKQYRTTPKAIVRLDDAQTLWGSRFGRLTGLRLAIPAGKKPAEVADAFSRALRSALDPARAGLAVQAVRTDNASASQGAVNFSEYFFYFSFFLVVSGMLLTGLFFKLGVEQRVREVGLLRAVGLAPERIHRIFLAEGLLLATLGSLLGLAAAAGYGALVMYGLRTWWVGAVGTTLLTLHVAPLSLAAGFAGGLLAAVGAIVWALRGLQLASPRDLMSGVMTGPGKVTAVAAPRRARAAGIAFAILGAALLAGGFVRLLPAVPAFFASGAALLVALLCAQWTWLAGSRPGILAGRGLPGFAQMGWRNAAWRPGRSLLCIILIASATFILVAVESFRRKPGGESGDARSGTGGYALLAESLLPLPYDPGTRAAQESLGLQTGAVATLAGTRFLSFRVRPGDDASCLNLYQPRNPKILGVPQALLAAGRFRFQASLAASPEERQNPWRLLEKDTGDGTIPAVVDANSMTYVLKRNVGDEFVLEKALDPATGQPVRLRIVGALADSIFQSEFLIAEKDFLRTFPVEPGYRFFLLDAPPEKAGGLSATLEEGLGDFGFDVQPAGERLAVFHRVENTYISTFQTLGGLGLLLGTVGLGAVLLRNVLERRRELALLRAVGYRVADLSWIVLAENVLLLAGGLISGTAAAVLAIAPALAERGGLGVAGSVALLLAGVLATGLAASLLAVTAVRRAPLLASLRSE